MNVIIDSRLVSYIDTGKKDAKVLLFIHGWADNSATFQDLTAGLSSKYRCVSVDLPGFGSSEIPRSAWGMSDFSEFMAKFLKKIQARPYAVIGHSNGGAIAIDAISSGKVSPGKLILLAASGIRNDQQFKKTIYKTAAKPAKIAINILPKKSRNALRKKLYSAIGSDYLVAENMKETFKNIVAHDVSEEAASLKIPTLLIYGEDDDATPPKISQKLHGLIKGSELVTLENTGHFIHQQKPEDVLRHIKDFLK